MSEEQETRKVSIDIYGKGQDEVTIDKATTVADLKTVLNLDKDIQAFDEKGKQLRNGDLVSGNSVNFVPNIQGGSCCTESEDGSLQ